MHGKSENYLPCQSENYLPCKSEIIYHVKVNNVSVFSLQISWKVLQHRYSEQTPRAKLILLNNTYFRRLEKISFIQR